MSNITRLLELDLSVKSIELIYVPGDGKQVAVLIPNTAFAVEPAVDNVTGDDARQHLLASGWSLELHLKLKSRTPRWPAKGLPA